MISRRLCLSWKALASHQVSHLSPWLLSDTDFMLPPMIELRKKTSGAALPQLFFDGFQLLDQDIYWQPTTAEELEEFGDTVDQQNRAQRYIKAIRKRKVN